MKRILVASLLVCSILISNTAHADVYYANPPTVYVAPDPYYQLGQGLGALFGNLFRAAQEADSQKKKQEAINTMRRNMLEGAKQDAAGLASFANNLGVIKAVEGLNQLSYKSGVNLNTVAHGDIIYMSFVDQKDPNFPPIEYEYSYNTRSSECRAIISIPAFNLREFGYAQYTEPKPQTPQYQPISQVVGDYLGITVNPDFTVSAVRAQGLADFAGFKVGDIITKIDTFPLDPKEYDLERVSAYIANRFNQKAIIKVTIKRAGKSKIIDVQL